MFSYRHEFHAGNHADVLKHVSLVAMLEYLKQKDKGFVYFDTHAGGAKYSLSSENALKTQEFEQGINLTQNAQFSSDILKRYLALVSPYLSQGEYLGSPLIAYELMRTVDRAVLMEWHNNEVEVLRDHCLGLDGVSIHHRDGFEGVVACLPHEIRRGVVLIDPPYEKYSEYKQVTQCVKDCLKRWKNGTYAIWYPMLTGEKAGFRSMLEQLARLPCKNMINISLQVRKQSEGMYGSGMCIVNPSWQLANQMESVLEELTPLLAQDDYATYKIDWLVNGE